MSDYTFAQLEGLWTDNGGSKRTAPTAAAIALAESSGDDQATSSNPDGGTNVGLWQLDTPGGVGAGYSVDQLMNPDLNAAVAVKGSGDGGNWSDWQTYAQGTYLQYLPGGAAAAAQSGPVGGASTTSDSSNVEWWDPLSWLNIPGDAAQSVASQVEDFVLHYGALALGVSLGLVLVGAGILRATRGHRPPNPVPALQQAAAPIAAAAAA